MRIEQAFALGLLLLFAVLAVAFLLHKWAELQRKLRTSPFLAGLKSLARRLDAEFVAATPDGPGGLRWTAHGRSALLRLAPDPFDAPAAVAVDVDLRGRSPGVLQVHPSTLAARMAGLLGAQDVRVGHAAFDAAFVVKARPEELARRIVSPEAAGALLSLGRPSIRLGRDALRITLPDPLREGPAILALAELARSLTAAALTLPSDGQIWILEEARRTGQCPVCATPLDTRVVTCEACRTPHHDECWSYAGACSTFGCGGKIPISAPRRAGPGGPAAPGTSARTPG